MSLLFHFHFSLIELWSYCNVSGLTLFYHRVFTKGLLNCWEDTLFVQMQFFPNFKPGILVTWDATLPARVKVVRCSTFLRKTTEKLIKAQFVVNFTITSWRCSDYQHFSAKKSSLFLKGNFVVVFVYILWKKVRTLTPLYKVFRKSATIKNTTINM